MCYLSRGTRRRSRATTVWEGIEAIGAAEGEKRRSEGDRAAAVGSEQRQRSGRRKQKGENGGKSPSRENLTQPIAAVRNDGF